MFHDIIWHNNGYDVASNIHVDVTMTNDVIMFTYHDVTMHDDVVMNHMYYVLLLAVITVNQYQINNSMAWKQVVHWFL